MALKLAEKKHGENRKPAEGAQQAGRKIRKIETRRRLATSAESS